MASGNIEYKTLKQYVGLQLDYISANIPLASGGILGPFITAIAYATALVALVLQRTIQLTFAAARLSTADGTDVDSFVADFGLSRDTGTKATGTVTFSRLSPAVTSILIPDGVVVQTSGSQPKQYMTTASNLSNYDSVQLGHILLVGNTSADANVIALEVGAASNVGASTINQIATTVPGIDNVTNAAQIVTGTDTQTDDQLKQDFINYIQSLSKATVRALGSAVTQGRESLVYTINENLTALNGGPSGQVSIYYDDGSGSAGGYQTAIQGALDEVRPAGVQVTAVAATASYALLVGRVTFKRRATYDALELRTLIRNAVGNRFNLKTKPGEQFYLPALVPEIFQASSPGDEVVTSVLLTPASTTLILKVASTTGMAAGQLVNVNGYTVAGGIYPTVKSVDDANTLVLNEPLVAVPPAGTIVTSYSIAANLVTDVQGIDVRVITASTSMNGWTNSGQFTVASTTGMSVGDLLVITDETNPLSPKYYQCNSNLAVNTAGQQLRIGALPGGNVITLENNTTTGKIGSLNADGTWTEAATSLVNSKVVAAAPSTTQLPFQFSRFFYPGANVVGRVRLAGPNAMSLQMEYRD